MVEWKYQYPSTALSRKYDQGNVYANQFRGEANKLLYELKNLMKFRNLGQLKMTRLFTDGTVITAWSIFGQDFINIDISRTISGVSPDIFEGCTVTFINLPDVVPPMRHPHEILSSETEGIHFIKTYYTVDISNCIPCENGEETVQWDFLFNFETPLTEYREDPENPDDIKEHCIVSEDGGCYAEVIDKGTDSEGTYIRWKVYTEGENQNRSGYGFVKINAVIYNVETGEQVCFAEQVIKVDCCIKDGLLPPDIYWESWERADCTEFMMYGSTKLCRVPGEISMTTLLLYASAGGGYFYAIPGVGGCPKYDWHLSGPGVLSDEEGLGETVRYGGVLFDELGCHDNVILSVTDRCGAIDTITTLSMCENAAPLSMNYTSLLMGCSQSQSLSAIGGVGPYVWSITSGGGSIEYYGNEALYTAPATNVNCVDNPTIQVTDCCGNTAEISLAVNCYTGGQVAITNSTCDPCSGCWCSDRGCDQGIIFCGDWMVWKYKCDGTLISYCETRPCGTGNPPCNGNTSGYHHPGPGEDNCGAECTDCWTNQCGGTHVCGISDNRSDAMKAGGCCPLNPETGLPY